MFGDPVDNPLGWEKRQLQQLVSDDCSISYGIVKTGNDVDGGVPVFRPVDIVGRIPVREDLKRTAPEISNQYRRSLLTGRELLVTVRANIADTFIAGEEFKGCNVGRGIVPIRTNESIIRLEFLKAQVDFDSMNRHMKALAKGITLIQLNMEDLRTVEFIVPSIDKQEQYIAVLQQSDKSKFAGANRNLSRCSVTWSRIRRAGESPHLGLSVITSKMAHTSHRHILMIRMEYHSSRQGTLLMGMGLTGVRQSIFPKPIICNASRNASPKRVISCIQRAGQQE